MGHVYSNKADTSQKLDPAELPGAAREKQAGGHKGEGRGGFFFFFYFRRHNCMCFKDGGRWRGRRDFLETMKLSTYQNKGL